MRQLGHEGPQDADAAHAGVEDPHKAVHAHLLQHVAYGL